TANAAFYKANGQMSTIYFPPGKYMTSKGFVMPNNIRWMGAGQDQTTIALTAAFTKNAPATFNPRYYALIYGDNNYNDVGNNVMLQHMPLDATGQTAPPTPRAYGLVREQFKSNVPFQTVPFLSTAGDAGYSAHPAVDFNGSNHVFMNGCTNISDGLNF